MTEPDPRPLNAELPAVESVRQLLADAERVSQELAQLADEMVMRAEAGRRDAQALIAALGEAREAVADEGMGSALSDAPTPEQPKKSKESPDQGSDGARILARQMLAGGADRELVEDNLRTSFGVKDAEAVVASILPPGD